MDSLISKQYQSTANEVNVEHDSWFLVGWFNFPMIDNIRLSKGQRVAVVLGEIQGGFAKAKLVFSPVPEPV